jgi:F0F1-type ATP synthase membrane subunit c/vacuolar-type H+-ATPase subunit K
MCGGENSKMYWELIAAIALGLAALGAGYTVGKDFALKRNASNMLQ